ncbi:ras-related protein Rab-18-B-like isoform X1 [Gallus gallus]|uniref:ras-related protein Rab-18-B-like isoform X1 n=1 Tax=Gallus gallus TaxID=9031 RepID=UPI001F006348|nr:ras-related protein Rab-18-B-like isoform X1 [Gallus gallus]
MDGAGITVKLILIGDSAVGKSRWGRAGRGAQLRAVRRSAEGSCVSPQPPAEDTAGQERFRTLNPSYYRGTQGIVLVYDVTRKDTFTGLDSWLNELEIYNTKSNTVKMLVGNKTDKPDREVERREGLQFAKKRSLLFIETSAKTEDGVQHAFEELVIKILQTPNLLDKSTKKQGVQLKESSQQEKSTCTAYCPLS